MGPRRYHRWQFGILHRSDVRFEFGHFGVVLVSSVSDQDPGLRIMNASVIECLFQSLGFRTRNRKEKPSRRSMLIPRRLAGLPVAYVSIVLFQNKKRSGVDLDLDPAREDSRDMTRTAVAKRDSESAVKV